MDTREYGRMKREQIQQARVAIRGSVYVLGKFKKLLAVATGRPAPIFSTEYHSDEDSQTRAFRAMYGE